MRGRHIAAAGLALLGLLLAGCAQGPGHTRAAGTLAGTAAGGIVGAAVSPCNRGGGAAVGALIGMMAGSMAGEGIALRPGGPAAVRSVPALRPLRRLSAAAVSPPGHGPLRATGPASARLLLRRSVLRALPAARPVVLRPAAPGRFVAPSREADAMSIDRVVVLGAGTMGHGIAQVAAQAGCRAALFDVDADAVRRGLARIASDLEQGVARGKVPAADRDAILARDHRLRRRPGDGGRRGRPRRGGRARATSTSSAGSSRPSGAPRPRTRSSRRTRRRCPSPRSRPRAAVPIASSACTSSIPCRAWRSSSSCGPTPRRPETVESGPRRSASGWARP